MYTCIIGLKVELMLTYQNLIIWFWKKKCDDLTVEIEKPSSRNKSANEKQHNSNTCARAEKLGSGDKLARSLLELEIPQRRMRDQIDQGRWTSCATR